jgi:lysophospholipase L1-like esterase
MPSGRIGIGKKLNLAHVITDNYTAMKIYVIGDSISIQYGPYLEANLRGIISYSRKEGNEEALLNLDKPRGANAGDSGMVKTFLEAKLATGDLDTDLILLNCGLHDIKVDSKTNEIQVPLNKYRENLKAIVEIVAQMNCQLIWIQSTPIVDSIHNNQNYGFFRFSKDVQAYNQAAEEIMTRASIPIIDLFSYTKNLSGELYCDHAHFHDHVRQQHAAFIAGWLMAFEQLRK